MANPLIKGRLPWDDGISADVLDEGVLRELGPGLSTELRERDWLLCHGDAFDLLALLPPESIDLVITSTLSD